MAITMNTADARRILETALLCSHQALQLQDMRVLLGNLVATERIKLLLLELQQEWTSRGLELINVATGWRFQSRAEMEPYLSRLQSDKPSRYARATLETLAIIAYKQPVTRGDIEDIRGVAVNSLLIKQLEDRGWIEVIGYRETIGKPALFATTKHFLDDLGLKSIDQLPLLSGEMLPAGTLGVLSSADLYHASRRETLSGLTPIPCNDTTTKETVMTGQTGSDHK